MKYILILLTTLFLTAQQAQASTPTFTWTDRYHLVAKWTAPDQTTYSWTAHISQAALHAATGNSALSSFRVKRLLAGHNDWQSNPQCVNALGNLNSAFAQWYGAVLGLPFAGYGTAAVLIGIAGLTRDLNMAQGLVNSYCGQYGLGTGSS